MTGAPCTHTAEREGRRAATASAGSPFPELASAFRSPHHRGTDSTQKDSSEKSPSHGIVTPQREPAVDRIDYTDDADGRMENGTMGEREAPGHERPRPRILIVDDEEIARVLIRQLLSIDYDVETAGTAEEALGKLAVRPFDLVITDQRMPGMRGTAFLAEVRDRHPDVVRIVLTAYADPEAMIEAINKGEAYRFVFKPWNPAEMRTEVAHAIEKRRLERERGAVIEKLTRALADLEDSRDQLLQAEKPAIAGRVAASFAHDIRNYLTVLTGLDVFRVRHRDDADLCEFLGFLDLVKADVSGMVSEIGALAQGETPVYQTTPGSLGAVAELATRFLARLAECPHRAIRVEARADMPLVPMAGGRIRRVIMNLLRNACEATPDGGEILVEVFADVGDACVRVVDPGSGIPANILPRIWEPFFTTKRGGTGLGLDICRAIVAGHGGRIEVESEPGRTAFTVRLPIETA